MGFYNKMEEITTEKLTENMSPTYSSSLSKNLDMFALGGASRNREDREITNMFGEAYQEKKELALRNLVHLRNIRHGGLGERRAFRKSLDYLLNKTSVDRESEQVVANLVGYLPDLGRWDDVVYVFANAQSKALKTAVARMIALQLVQDKDDASVGKEISLLSKWLPSVNTSSQETKKTARELVTYIYGARTNRNEKKYRKLLSYLRNHLNVLEVKMSSKKWNQIDYNKVPSVASVKYRTAFHRNDGNRYEEYLDGLATGESKVNASVTYPYQIVQAYDRHYGRGEAIDRLLEGAWDALPDYIEGSDERAIVVADTSGSMTGTPMDVSVSLAIYCAQKLKGEFAGKYISFSNNPTLNSINVNGTLSENLDRVYQTDWGMSTDIDKVFKLVLDTAKRNNMKQDELPNKIIIVSDMEFDNAQSGWGSEEFTATNYQNAKRNFKEAGYEIPQIIFWNVDARSNVIPVRKDEVGTALVSGLTPTIFKTILNGDIMDPEKHMLDVLYNENYDFVKGLLAKGGE